MQDGDAYRCAHPRCTLARRAFCGTLEQVAQHLWEYHNDATSRERWIVEHHSHDLIDKLALLDRKTRNVLLGTWKSARKIVTGYVEYVKAEGLALPAGQSPPVQTADDVPDAPTRGSGGSAAESPQFRAADIVRVMIEPKRNSTASGAPGEDVPVALRLLPGKRYEFVAGYGEGVEQAYIRMVHARVGRAQLLVASKDKNKAPRLRRFDDFEEGRLRGRM